MGKWVHRLSEVDLESQTAVCSNCGPVEIYVASGLRRCIKAMGRTGRQGVYRPGEHRMVVRDLEAGTGECSTCGPITMNRIKGSWGCPERRRRPDKLRMTAAERSALRDGKPCEICGMIAPQMVLDHKHGEKTWRGVLCCKHNTGLGMFDDDPALLEAAAEYLRKHV